MVLLGSGLRESYLVTSGADAGSTCFIIVWIQFRRMPDVMADRVNSPSLVYTKNTNHQWSGHREKD